jgi:Protein of unknown function (DUF2852)
MMTIAARLDELARPAWIALIVLGFIFWWPLGLAILAFGLWSGKMGCCGVGFTGRHHDADRIHQAEDRWRQPRTSGSRAFDEYRVETLRRLEEEQRQFHEFLGRLRMARDKAEFDQFMAVRRARTEPPASTPPA